MLIVDTDGLQLQKNHHGQDLYIYSLYIHGLSLGGLVAWTNFTLLLPHCILHSEML